MLERILIKVLFVLGVFLVVAPFFGCGRMGQPFAPEQLAPVAVRNLEIIAEPTSVLLTWESPERDRRGKELKSMNGYYVKRRVVTKPSDMTDPEVESERLKVIVDQHVVERDRLRKEARDANRPSHRVSVPAQMTKFEFRDNDVQAGGRYVYEIVPVNQETVEGEVRQPVKVLFRGEASEISFLDRTSSMDDFFAE